tara:strand:+ start:17 stop:442 length:426 start_codon:yes stop_codon:yes gene_type:complete
MNTVLLAVIFIPIVEIYLFIKIGSQIGALNTIILIFLTAITGVYYARYEGINTLRSGISQIVKNQVPARELISGAAIAFAAVLLIIPGFATDIIGFLLIIPFTRKLILGKLNKKFETKKQKKNDFIEGEFEDIEDENDRKI